MSYEGAERRSEPRKVDELTESEIQELRRIIEEERRMKWLWASIRNLAVWIVAIITGITVGYQALIDVVRSLAGTK